MEIPVLGMDPSLTHWGLAEGILDLNTGFLGSLQLSVVEPEKTKLKQVRQNSIDLAVAEQLAEQAIRAARQAKAVFVECPVGSQSARAMASYGICVGVLGAIRALGIPIIEVTATEVKVALTGDKNATKQKMIDAAVGLYPEAIWPTYQQNGKGYKKGELKGTAEHVADAIATIHAGVRVPAFQTLMQLYRKVA